MESPAMCKVYSKFTIRHQNVVIDIELLFYCYRTTDFRHYSVVSTVDFEQVNDRCARFNLLYLMKMVYTGIMAGCGKIKQAQFKWA